MPAPTPRPRLTLGVAQRTFAKFNRRYFDGELKTPEIRVVPAGQAGSVVNACGDWGGCQERGEGEPALIELRAVAREINLTYFHSNLLHEMAHLSIGTEHDHRSKEWKAEIRRLGEAGALIEVI